MLDETDITPYTIKLARFNMSRQREKSQRFMGEIKSLEAREHISPADSDRRVREDVLDMFGFG